MNFSTWMENGQNCYLTWQAVSCFVFSCDEMWFLLLSNELQLHMVHNYILIYVRNWLRILGKQNALIFNIASIHLPNKEILVNVQSPPNSKPPFLWSEQAGLHPGGVPPNHLSDHCWHTVILWWYQALWWLSSQWREDAIPYLHTGWGLNVNQTRHQNPTSWLPARMDHSGTKLWAAGWVPTKKVRQWGLSTPLRESTQHLATTCQVTAPHPLQLEAGGFCWWTPPKNSSYDGSSPY
jgi:hypothetical protein